MLTNLETEREFLSVIALDSDNDANRLIYADWLEEEGDLRCELVRVQVQLSNLGEFADPRLLHPLRQREEQLGVLLRPMRDHFRLLGVSKVVIRRGVLEGIAIQGQAFLKNAQRLFFEAPAITDLDLIGGNSLFNGMEQIQGFHNVRSLRVGGRFETNELTELRNLINSSNIEGLTLYYSWAENSQWLFNEIGPKLKRLDLDLSAFSSNTYFPRSLKLPAATWLRIQGSRFSLIQMRELFASMNGDLLTHLDLQNGRFGEEVGLVTVEQFHSLKTLAVDEINCFSVLAASPLMSSLECLKLTCRTEIDLHHLRELPFEKLRLLEIKVPRTASESDLTSLLQAPFVSRLYTLHIKGGDIPQSRFDRLRESLSEIPGWETGSKRMLITDVCTWIF